MQDLVRMSRARHSTREQAKGKRRPFSLKKALLKAARQRKRDLEKERRMWRQSSLKYLKVVRKMSIDLTEDQVGKTGQEGSAAGGAKGEDGTALADGGAREQASGQGGRDGEQTATHSDSQPIA